MEDDCVECSRTLGWPDTPHTVMAHPTFLDHCVDCVMECLLREDDHHTCELCADVPNR